MSEVTEFNSDTMEPNHCRLRRKVVNGDHFWAVTSRPWDFFHKLLYGITR